MFKLKKQIDEREEQEMNRIGSTMFWVVYILLFVSIMAQMIMGAEYTQYIAEFVIFMIACVAMVVISIRGGHWEVYVAPKTRNNVIYGLISAVIATGMGVAIAREKLFTDFTMIKLGIIVAVFIGTFVVTFVILQITMFMTLKRREKIADQMEDEEQEDI